MSTCDLPRRLIRSARRIGASLFIALLVALLPMGAQAATIAVDGTTCTLEEAIPVANLDADANGCTRVGGGSADTLVLVPLSTTSYIAGPFSHDGLTATPSVTSTMTISGGVGGATIQRTGILNFRLFHVAADGDLTLESIDVVNGNITGNGGAIFNRGSLTLIDSALVENVASGNGGAIYSQTGSNLEINASGLLTNSAVEGGAIYLTGGTLTSVSSDYVDNSATYGGALANYATSSADFDDDYFISNEAAQDGGAIYNYDHSTLAFIAGEMSENQAANLGGAVVNDTSSDAYFSATQILTNSASSGGGIYNINSSNLELSHVDFISNTATSNGGALFNGQNSDVTLGFNQILSNTAALAGGGIYNGSSSVITYTIGTIAFNAAASGGGLYSDGASATLSVMGIISNTAVSGAGIFNFNGSDTHLLGAGFLGNQGVNGGGVLNSDSSTLTFEGVQLVANHASASGGGLFNQSSSTAVMTATIFLSNTAVAWGGGVYNELDATLTMIDGEVTGSEASYGGALYNTGSNADFFGTQLLSNTVTNDGGAIYNELSATLTMTNGEVSGNEASSGGGLYNTTSGANFVGTKLLANRAANDGGAIYNDTGDVDILGATLALNEATNGAGLYNAGGTQFYVADSFVLTNTASDEGGGAYNRGLTLTFDGTEIVGNDAEVGGGVYNTQGYASVLGGEVLSNTATSGAGLANQNGGLTVDDVTVRANVATSNGGGVYVQDGFELYIVGSRIISNSATFGAALYNSNNPVGTVTATDIFSNTAATWGGGIFNTNGSDLALSLTKISYNHAAQDGGGLFNTGVSTATLTEVELLSNSAVALGGALVNGSGSVMSLDETHVLSNTAGDAAGLYNDGLSVAITSSLFFGNSATNGGGGLYNINSTMVVTDTAVAANDADYGGGVATLGGTFSLMNSVLYSNTVTNQGGGLYQISGTSTIDQSCVVGNDADAIFYDAGTVIDATDVWWGAPDGPSGAGLGAGDSVSANVDFDPFLTSSIFACLARVASIELSKSASPAGPYMPGQPLTYTIAITNMGDQAINNLFITDPLPAAFVPLDVLTSGATITPDGDRYVVDTIPVSGVVTIELVGQVTTTLTSDVPLDNTVTVTSSLVGLVTASTSSNVLVPVVDWSSDEYVANENSGTFTATATLTPPNPYMTATVQAVITDSTEVAFINAVQTVSFVPGSGSAPVPVAITDDSDVLSRTITLSLQSPVGARLGNQSIASIALIEDDALPAIAVTKNANVSQAIAGDTITYTVRITNTGNVTFTSVSGNDNPLGALSGLGGQWIPGEGRSTTLTYVVQPGDAGTNLVNTVVVTGTDIFSTVVNNNASETVTIFDPQPSIAVTKRANVALAVAGDTITYTVRITNTGNVTFAAVSALDDPLGALSGLGGQWIPNEARNATLTYVVQAGDAGTSVVNTVVVTGTDIYGTDVNDNDSVSVTIADPQPSIAVTKFANVDSAMVGETITYIYFITNTGNVTLTTVSATDDPLGALPGLGGLWIPNEARNATLTYVVQAGDAGTSLVNTVVVTGTDIFATVVNDSESVTVNIAAVEQPAPAIAVSKSANVTQATVGDTITYTYRITNTGNITLTTVSATDDRLGALPGLGGAWLPGEARSATLTYVTQAADANTVIVNTVDVTGTDPFGTDVTDSAILSVTVSNPTNLPEGEQPQQRQELYLPKLDN